MECDKFESLLIDELYGELDEVTSAAVKRHAAGCARCSGLLSGLRATRKVAVLPIEEPSSDLEDRILSAVREQQKVLPFRARVSVFLSRAGAWAMRPQTAMAAVLVLVIGTSLVMVQGRKSMKAASEMPAAAEGAPVRPLAGATATAAASALAFDQREGDFAHGLAEQEKARGPARIVTLATTDNAPKNQPADDLKKEESANAAAVGGAPLARAETKSLDTDGVPQGQGQASTGGMRGNEYQPTAPPPPPAATTTPAETQQQFGGDKDKNPCSQAAIQALEQQRTQSSGTKAGNDATLQLARCYRAAGNTQLARARYSTLLQVQDYAQTAQQELDQMAPAAAAHKAAPQMAPRQQADSY